MKHFLYWILVIGFLAVLVFTLFNKKDAPVNQEREPVLTANDIKQIKIGGAVLDLELALTLEAQAKGLSGHSELNDGDAMLFVFDVPNKYSFWMKDMDFPIDIIWMSEDLQVVYIKKNASPESYPEAFMPEVDAKYVLETVSGFSENHNLKEGDRVEFVY